MNRSTDGFTLIELLIVIAIIGILAAALIPNLLAARNRAYDAVAQAYLREVVTSVETALLGDFSLPPRQPCASLAGKPHDPTGVVACAYEPLARGAFFVTVRIASGSVFRFDGEEIEKIR